MRVAMDNGARSSKFGVVVSIRGSVVDIRFKAQLPPIYALLHRGTNKQIVVEVTAQRNARHVHGIALTPTQGLALGMALGASDVAAAGRQALRCRSARPICAPCEGKRLRLHWRPAAFARPEPI
jgi:hypothetical protein